MEVVKNIAAVLGTIISAASLITLMSKTARQAIAGLFKKYGNSDDMAEIKQLLERHLEEDKKFKEDISEMNDINMEFTRTQCRTIIKNIFYKYDKTKVLPLYEKKTLMSVKDLYVNRLHGNSFAIMMLDEMDGWEVDYESSHPGEDEG
ncbi:MAG: hypothetical protein PUB94_05955 [Oscillospiraceae bacterium]|nr:hypothetical protein [Oscillospiraceae bacterium]